MFSLILAFATYPFKILGLLSVEETQTTQLPMPSEGTSPFPFLNGESQDTINAVHTIISGPEIYPENADQSINALLTDFNQKVYHAYKQQHKVEFPMEIAHLSIEDRQNVLLWIARNYDLKYGRYLKEHSLGEILTISRKMLENFQLQLYKKIQREDGMGVIETVKALRCPADVDQSNQKNLHKNAQQVIVPRHENSVSHKMSNSLYEDASDHIPDNANNGALTTINSRTFHKNPSLQSGYSSDQNNRNGQNGTQTPPYNNSGYHQQNAATSLVPNHQNQELQEDENSLNIVITGETGVGKTTFINAFQNYLKYSSLEEALDKGPIVPIRISFNMVIEENSQPVDITIEPPYKLAERANEQLFTEKGQSRTQNAMIHKFRYTSHGKERTVCLVDTPGVMDTRGDVKDEENYHKTIEVIATLKHIHAICVLLKPNEARLTKELTRALDLLLKRLPSAAVERIVFCFTSTETFDFTPSQTLPVLQEYLETLGNDAKTKVSARKENIFCFDNNSFRFQCAVKQFPECAVKKWKYEKSWRNNVNQLQRMLKYIQPMTPYLTTDSVNVAQVERRLHNFMGTFMTIIKDHVGEITFLKTKKKSWKPLSKEEKKNEREIEEREKCFKYFLMCCSYFTTFLKQNSIAIEDLISINISTLIKEAEIDHKSQRTDGNATSLEEFRRIGREYRNISADIASRYYISSEDIEQLLLSSQKWRYYALTTSV